MDTMQETLKQDLLASARTKLATDAYFFSRTVEQQESMIYVEALYLSDHMVGDIFSVQASLVEDIQSKKLLSHHPDQYRSLQNLLHCALQAEHSAGHLSELRFMREKVLPDIQEEIKDLPELPPVSNLCIVASACRKALKTNDKAEVVQLVRAAATMPQFKLRSHLRQEPALTISYMHVGEDSYQISGVISGFQLSRFKRTQWITMAEMVEEKAKPATTLWDRMRLAVQPTTGQAI